MKYLCSILTAFLVMCSLVSIQAQEQPPVLSGPDHSVDDAAQQKSNRGFAGGGGPKADLSVSTLAGPLGMSEAQKEQMRATITSFIARERSYKEKYRQERVELRAAIRQAMKSGDKNALNKAMDREAQIMVDQPTREQMIREIRDSLNEDQSMKYLWLLWKGRGHKSQTIMVMYDILLEMELDEEKQKALDALLLEKIRASESYLDQHAQTLIRLRTENHIARQHKMKDRVKSTGREMWKIRRGALDRDTLREDLVKLIGPEKAKELKAAYEATQKKYDQDKKKAKPSTQLEL